MAVAALQMWRMESSLTLNPDLIGVDNPEKDPHKVGNYYDITLLQGMKTQGQKSLYIMTLGSHRNSSLLFCKKG